MVVIYVTARFAKMIAVPDKLIETPHTYAIEGRPWTFLTTSWDRFA